MSHPLGRNAAESATLMFLTRLALFFNTHPELVFRGKDVAEIILGAWQSYEMSKSTPAVERYLNSHFPAIAPHLRGDLIESLVSTVEHAEKGAAH